MAKREPTPNYDLMFQSAVFALQSAYSKYKRASSEELRWTFFDNDGNLSVLDGYKERREKLDKAEAEVVRLMKEVSRLRDLKGGDSE